MIPHLTTPLCKKLVEDQTEMLYLKRNNHSYPQLAFESVPGTDLLLSLLLDLWKVHCANDSNSMHVKYN